MRDKQGLRFVRIQSLLKEGGSPPLVPCHVATSFGVQTSEPFNSAPVSPTQSSPARRSAPFPPTPTNSSLCHLIPPPPPPWAVSQEPSLFELKKLIVDLTGEISSLEVDQAHLHVAAFRSRRCPPAPRQGRGRRRNQRHTNCASPSSTAPPTRSPLCDQFF